MQELELLQKKIELLLNKCLQLKEENKQLKEAVATKDTEKGLLDRQYQDLKVELEIANEAKQDTQVLRSQVDNAIADVDKILELIDAQ